MELPISFVLTSPNGFIFKLKQANSIFFNGSWVHMAHPAANVPFLPPFGAPPPQPEPPKVPVPPPREPAVSRRDSI